MVHQLKITLKPGIVAAEGDKIRKNSADYFGIRITEVKIIRVLSIDKTFQPEPLARIQQIFTNPVTQVSSYQWFDLQFDWLIWVGFLPGVQDVQGNTAVEAIEDLTKSRFENGENCYTSKTYILKSNNLTRNDCELIARELLANDLINQWMIKSWAEWEKETGLSFPIPRVELVKDPLILEIPLDSNEILKKTSETRHLSLYDEDIPVIRKYFLREDVKKERRKVGLKSPTDVEFEYIAQARSDHCNHNTFRGFYNYTDTGSGEKFTINNLFKTCIEEPTLKIQEMNPWVLSVLWDNAGVGKFDENHCYTITGETHNSPSNMEAYGGALTGIVGVYRDPLGTGKSSRIVLGTYGFCTGDRDYQGPLKPRLHPRRLLDGIIAGVKDGGNKSGIPTPLGLVYFDPGYMGKCLVFVTAVGIMPLKIKGSPSYEKKTRDGDCIFTCGGRVGKDGIHGVTASSDAYNENTPAGHVQIGDPYTQKKLHDFILDARDKGLIEFITDCGGGGLSSAIGESARFSRGCKVDLAKVPLKYQGLDPWEIWVSESQERMVVAVNPVNKEEFKTLAQQHAVEVTEIGNYTSTGVLHLLYNGKTCAYMHMDFLESEFPQRKFNARWIPPKCRNLHEPVISEPLDHGKLLKTMLARPNIASTEWITRQYDHEVQGGSVIKPLVGKENDIPTDAAVIRPVLESTKGLAIAQAINPGYGKIDTYNMVQLTIDETVRRLVSVGCNPGQIGGVDNFCWPNIRFDPKKNPDGEYKAAQLVRACLALRDSCLAMGIPLLSGKDSMYVDGEIQGIFGERRKISGLPAMMFTGISVVDNVMNCVTMDAKAPGDLVYVVGVTKDELGGSEYYALFHETGVNVPAMDFSNLMSMYAALAQTIKKQLPVSVHGIYRGGLAVHLALVSMGGMLGMEINIADVPKESSISDAQVLYSESAGRFIVTVPGKNQQEFESIMKNYPCAVMGKVASETTVSVTGMGGYKIIDLTLEELKFAWKKRFGDLV